MQTPASVPVAPPLPPLPARVIIKPGVDGPQAVYRAYNEQRKELARQLDNLEGKRRQLSEQIAFPGTDKSAKAELEVRLAELDKRIADVDKQLAAADKSVANAAAVPGAVIEQPREEHRGPPDEVFIIPAVFIMFVMFPLALAYARRIWKRGTPATAASFPREFAERMDRLDQSLDSIAIEVERIGEGQRFVTRVMSENGRAVGAGAAQPIEAGVRAKASVAREADRP